MRRGEIRWHTFQSPDKRRPVLVLTRTSVLRSLQWVTIAPITSTIRGIPTEVHLTPEDGVARDCAVSLDNVQTVQQRDVGAYITTLSDGRMHQVADAITFALALYQTE